MGAKKHTPKRKQGAMKELLKAHDAWMLSWEAAKAGGQSSSEHQPRRELIQTLRYISSPLESSVHCRRSATKMN